MTARRKNAGFTLLELILAVAIFAVTFVLAYGGLNAVLDGRELVDQRVEELRDLSMAIRALEGDLEQLQARPIRDQFGDTQPALLMPDSERLELTRGGWRNPLFRRRSHLQRVAYRLEEGELIREYWLTLDRPQQAESEEDVLLEGITELQWRFLDAAREWQDTWPPLNSGGLQPDAVALPLAVELTLESEQWGDLRYLFQIRAESS